jgi:paraquat-inducible protein B
MRRPRGRPRHGCDGASGPETRRAYLATESIVTGLLFVSLDTRPDTPIRRVMPPASQPFEIPTIPTALEQVQSAATEIIAKIEELEIAPLIDKATATLAGLDEIVHSPDLKRALAALDDTIVDLDNTLPASAISPTISTATPGRCSQASAPRRTRLDRR